MVTMRLGSLPGRDNYSFHKVTRIFSSFVVSFFGVLEFWRGSVSFSHVFVGPLPQRIGCLFAMWQIIYYKALQTAKATRGQPYQPYLRCVSSNLLAEASSRQGAKVVLDAIGRSRTKATFFDQARKGLDENAWRLVQAGVFSCLVRLKWGMRVCKPSHKQDGKKGKALLWAGLCKPNRVGNVSHRWLGHSKCHRTL